MTKAAEFKAIMSHYASGLTVIGTLVDGKPVGFTCQSFHSVSVEPPLISFNVMRTSTSWPIIRAQGAFSVNVLSHQQSTISNALARSGPDKWNSIAWQPTPAGHPMLDECLVWMDCELYDEHEAGDHTLILARITGMQEVNSVSSLPPLIFYRGRYCSLSPQA